VEDVGEERAAHGVRPSRPSRACFGFGCATLDGGRREQNRGVGWVFEMATRAWTGLSRPGFSPGGRKFPAPTARFGLAPESF
jgi:hypothetical protein